MTCVNLQKQAIFTESYLLQRAATLQTLTNTSTRVSRVSCKHRAFLWFNHANDHVIFCHIMCECRESSRIEVADLIQELQPFVRSRVPRVLSRDEI